MRVKLGLNCRLCCEISFTETLMMDHGVVSPLEYIRIQKLFNLRFPIIIVILKQWSISKLINLLINCLIGYFNKGRSDFNPSFFMIFWNSTAMNSAILQGNSSYLDDLAQFLKSINGNHSRWVLCYRASTHGRRISTFHTKCDGKRDTVSIIKVG